MPIRMALQRKISALVCVLTAASMLLSLAPAAFACACVAADACPLAHSGLSAPQSTACCEKTPAAPVRSCCDSRSHDYPPCSCCVSHSVPPANESSNNPVSDCSACDCQPAGDSIPASTASAFAVVDLCHPVAYSVAVGQSAADSLAQRFRAAHHLLLPTDLVIVLSRLTC